MLKTLRRAKGLSQTALAREVGVTLLTVFCWETGKCFPQIRHLKRLSDVLSISIDRLEEMLKKPNSNQIKRR